MSDYFPGINPAHKGRLHHALGIPEDEKIPADRLQEAAHSRNPKMREMANYAERASHFKKKGRHRMPPPSK